MKTNHLVSIIVPVYNVEKYVKKCLDFLLVQTYKNTEIIVIDDGSIDESGRVCDELKSKNNQLVVVHQKNKGLSGARNAGIKIAKGEFICFVDSDDYVKKDFIDKMMKNIDDDTDIVVCGFNNEVPSKNTLSGELATIKLLTKQENIEVIAWNKMYRRSLFKDIKFPEGDNYEDTLTTYKLLSRARKVVYIPESLYVYVDRSDSITKSDDKEKRLIARERAAKESLELFRGKRKLESASWIALLTAKLAWMDFAMKGEVDKKRFYSSRKWIIDNYNRYRKNDYMNSKLKCYLLMIKPFGGMFYKLFRVIKHN